MPEVPALVGNPDRSWKSRLLEVSTTAESSDDMRASLLDYLREHCFCIEPEVLKIYVGTFNVDLNGWILL